MLNTYKNSGVDIDKGNQFVNIIKDICKNDKIGGFSGIYELDNNIKLCASTDGVGTKLELCRKYNKYDTIGIDLVAMCVNDLICQGGKPLFFLDYYATGKLDLEKSSDIIKGIYEGCKQSGCVLLGGETAEMPMIYDNDKFDLAGFSVGIIESDIYPKDIYEGDIIVGLKSNGIHSNGYSLINKLLEKYEYDQNELLKPTKIYVNIINHLKSKFYDNIKGFSHITGGGLIDNILRILDNDHKILLNQQWDIPDIFKWIYDKSDMTLEDMLKTYNCGVGMVIIFDKMFGKHILLKKYELIFLGYIIKNDKNIIEYDKIKKCFI